MEVQNLSAFMDIVFPSFKPELLGNRAVIGCHLVLIKEERNQAY
jgi:hypothetical protein